MAFFHSFFSFLLYFFFLTETFKLNEVLISAFSFISYIECLFDYRSMFFLLLDLLSFLLLVLEIDLTEFVRDSLPLWTFDFSSFKI
jgi:hypothetical protein